MDLKSIVIKRRLVSGYLLKESDLDEAMGEFPRYNLGANVYIHNGYLFFVSDSGDLCMMYTNVARWFNWNDMIHADLSDIVIDLDDPFPVSVYFNDKKYKRGAKK